MLRLPSASLLLVTLSASAAITVACGDDNGSGEEHTGTEPAVCMEISSVCHDADTGSGMAHDCHEQAHQGDAALCEMIHDECIAFCTGGGTGTETGTSMTMTTSDATTGSESVTDEGTTHAHDESGSTGHDDESSTAADHGTDHGTEETGAPDSCDLLGSGCHDNKTPEGMECHDLGHDGDVAACDEAFEMCAKICGL